MRRSWRAWVVRRGLRTKSAVRVVGASMAEANGARNASSPYPRRLGAAAADGVEAEDADGRINRSICTDLLRPRNRFRKRCRILAPRCSKNALKTRLVNSRIRIHANREFRVCRSARASSSSPSFGLCLPYPRPTGDLPALIAHELLGHGGHWEVFGKPSGEPWAWKVQNMYHRNVGQPERCGN